MTERARREYAEVMRRRYRIPGDKRERGRLLDEYCGTTGVIARRRFGA